MSMPSLLFWHRYSSCLDSVIGIPQAVPRKILSKLAYPRVLDRNERR